MCRPRMDTHTPLHPEAAMKHAFSNSRAYLPLLTAMLLAALLAGCAADTRRSGRVQTHDTLVQMQLQKQAQGADCAVSVRITNRMPNTNWDAASYQVALLDRKNVTRGKLAGAPRRYTRYGQVLEDSGTVHDVRCDDLVAVSVIYFGYYPPGKRQTSLHLSNVKAELR